MAVRTKSADEVAADRSGAHRFGALLALLVATYLISAFASGSWVRVLQTGLFLVVVLIAVRTGRASRPVRRLANVVLLAGSVVALALTQAAASGPAAGAGFTWIALMLLLAVIFIIERVLSGREITLQSIFGAISAYLIIGLMFAATYAAISKFSSGPFFANGQPASIANFQYFSFTTLTTVGYGDFTAAASDGRAVAMLEALLGQVFLVTLVGKLVAGYRSPRSPEGRAQQDRAPARTASAPRVPNRRRPPRYGPR